MTRSDVVDAILADGVEFNRRQCGEVLSAMLEEIFCALDEGRKYTQQGFGVFETYDTNERVGINPFTKQKVRYPKKRRLRFKSAKLLKDTLNAE